MQVATNTERTELLTRMDVPFLSSSNDYRASNQRDIDRRSRFTVVTASSLPLSDEVTREELIVWYEQRGEPAICRQPEAL
jgi:hypothetical protein